MANDMVNDTLATAGSLRLVLGWYSSSLRLVLGWYSSSGGGGRRAGGVSDEGAAAQTCVRTMCVYLVDPIKHIHTLFLFHSLTHSLSTAGGGMGATQSTPILSLSFYS
jgi:hypothetical protein